jgi:hypothetical protein
MGGRVIDHLQARVNLCSNLEVTILNNLLATGSLLNNLLLQIDSEELLLILHSSVH